jgi:Ca2+-binding EF-hand superfamily protein
VNKMALRECLSFIFKWVWLRSKSNFDERNILWNVLDRPSVYIDAEKFRQCIFKNMGLQINNTCLQQIMQKYGGGENKINFDLFIRGYRALTSANSFNDSFTEHKTGYNRNKYDAKKKFNFEGAQFRGNSNDIEKLMHQKIKERANPKIGQFKQTFMMFAPERFTSNFGPPAWENHFSSFDNREGENGGNNKVQTNVNLKSARQVSKQYAYQQKKESDMGITPALLKERLKKIGILASDEQVADLFRKYDVDNSGHLTFYEFAKRAVPPDYKGKGKLYRLTGGNDDSDEEEVDTSETKLEEGMKPALNMNVFNSDVEHYLKNRNILSTPYDQTPNNLYWPREQSREATSFSMRRQGYNSMPNIRINNNNTSGSSRNLSRLNSRASRIHSSQSLRYNGRFGRGSDQNGLSNAEKCLLLQEYKRKRYLKKIKGLQTKVGKTKKVTITNRLRVSLK